MQEQLIKDSLIITLFIPHYVYDGLVFSCFCDSRFSSGAHGHLYNQWLFVTSSVSQPVQVY